MVVLWLQVIGPDENGKYGRDCERCERKQRLWSLCTGVERSGILKVVSRLLACNLEIGVSNLVYGKALDTRYVSAISSEWLMFDAIYAC